MKFLGTLNTALNFVNPTANTTIQIPAKATPGVYTLATLEDIPVAICLHLIKLMTYFLEEEMRLNTGLLETTFMILVMQIKGF
jgi:hypothetical protein